MASGRLFWMMGWLFPAAIAFGSINAPPVGSSQWLAAATAALRNGTPIEQQSARRQLIQAGELKSAAAKYPASLTATLLPVLSGGNRCAKLNAAVVLERVANKTASPALLPAVSMLLDDRSDAVALWGIKSVRR